MQNAERQMDAKINRRGNPSEFPTMTKIPTVKRFSQSAAPCRKRLPKSIIYHRTIFRSKRNV